MVSVPYSPLDKGLSSIFSKMGINGDFYRGCTVPGAPTFDIECRLIKTHLLFHFLVDPDAGMYGPIALSADP
jgi:hypothetical protein